MSERPIPTTAPLPDVGSYHDLRSLNQLRQLGASDEKAALRAAAKQFESVFLQELLKSMRAANDVFEDDDFFGGGGSSEFYEQMHDEQLALSLANQQSLGLAEVMVQQLSRAPAKREASAVSPAPATPFAAPANPLTSVRPPLQAAQNPEPMTPQAFVATVLPHAERVAASLGVDPALLVAQSALETGWGKGMAMGEGGKVLPAHAANTGQHYFGIKADSRWQGPVVHAQTLEYVAGLPERQRASFRAYHSPAEAFADYAQFIQSSPRYAEALKNAADPQRYAEGLQQAGYATDPAYANKLMRVFNSDFLRDLIAEARKLL